MNAKKLFDLAAKGFKKRFDDDEPQVEREFKDDNERLKEANAIIQNHVLLSMGAGLIPVIMVDIFAVSALQLDMINQLCGIYNVDYSETQTKAIVTSLTSSTLARVGGSLVKMIPGVGSLLGGVTVSVFAGASTYALGEVFKKHFESGGTILDFDPQRVRKMYKEKFEKGKKVAEQIRRENQRTTPNAGGTKLTNEELAKTDEVLNRIQELGKLKDQGIITEEEFNAMKQKLIKGL